MHYGIDFTEEGSRYKLDFDKLKSAPSRKLSLKPKNNPLIKSQVYRRLAS